LPFDKFHYVFRLTYAYFHRYVTLRYVTIQRLIGQRYTFSTYYVHTLRLQRNNERRLSKF